MRALARPAAWLVSSCLALCLVADLLAAPAAAGKPAGPGPDDPTIVLTPRPVPWTLSSWDPGRGGPDSSPEDGRAFVLARGAP